MYNIYEDIKFSIIKEYEDVLGEDHIPQLATKGSAGYDLCAAKDTLIPSIFSLVNRLSFNEADINSTIGTEPFTLSEVEKIIKLYGEKATLIPTGLKCEFPENTVMNLYGRSSLAHKHYIIIANSVGIIDSDYANNESNEGHIHVMVINLLPFDILVKKGDRIAQAVFNPISKSKYSKIPTTKRKGGYGSTGNR